MVRRLAVLAVMATAGLAMGRAPAHADDESMVWTAPRGCPGAAELRGRVVAQLGRELLPDEVDVRMQVTRHGKRWRVDMTVRTVGGEGERTLEAGSCDELADAAALIVALTIGEAAMSTDDDEVEIDEIDPESESSAAAATAVAAADDFSDDERPPPASLGERRYLDTRADDEEPAPPLEVALRARALVIGDLGSMPGPAIGFGGAAELAVGPWSLDVSGQFFQTQQAMQPGFTDQGAEVGLTSLVARGCYATGPYRWRAGGCIGGDLEIMSASGFGFEENYERTSTYGGGVQGGVTWAVRLAGPLSLRADVTATMYVVRPVLIEAGGIVIFDPNVLVWRGVAALEAAWE